MPAVTWEFELKDKATANARKATTSIQQTQAALKSLNAEAGKGNQVRMFAINQKALKAFAADFEKAQRSDARRAREAARSAATDARAQTARARAVSQAQTMEARNASRIRIAVERAQAVVQRREAQSTSADQRRAEQQRRATATATAKAHRESEAAASRSNRAQIQHTQAQHASAMDLFGVFGQVAGIAAQITAAAAGIGLAFAGVAFTIGRSVVEMIRFREGAVTTLGSLLRPQGSGGREMISRTGSAALRQTQDIARMTPTSESGVIQARQRVAAAGFRGTSEREALAASLDVSALNPNDASAQQRFLIGLGQMRNAARLTMQDVRQTAEAASLSPSDIMRRAALIAGITQRQGETELAYQRRIDQARLAGRITGAQGVQATYQTLSASTGENLGGFARNRGNSLDGAMSNLEESLTGLVTGGAELENLPGVRSFAASIAAIGNALNGSSAAGQRLQAVVGGLINGAGAAFGQMFSPARIERFVSGMTDLVPVILQVVGAFGGPFMAALRTSLGPMLAQFSGGAGSAASWVQFAQALGTSLGYLVGIAVQVTAAFGATVVVLGFAFSYLSRFAMFVTSIFTGIGGLIAGFVTTLGQASQAIGTAIVDGIRNGLSSAWAGLTDTISGLAQSLPDTVRNVLGIHSPSRVFMELGAHTARGMALGIEGGSADVRRAVDGMVGAPSGGAGRAGGGALVSIGSLTIYAGSDEQAQDIRAELEDLFAGLLDRAALAGGA